MQEGQVLHESDYRININIVECKWKYRKCVLRIR